MNVDKHLNYKVLDCTTTVADNPLENIRIDICIEKTFLENKTISCVYIQGSRV